MTAQLDVHNLEVSYGQARALNGVSFSVPSGSLNAVVGANGAGKTSLVRAIAGMLRPSGGQVLFNGIDITGLESSETCELGIGQVAFLHIDMNCAYPERAALEYFWDRLSPGAVVLFDDYAYFGNDSLTREIDSAAEALGTEVLSLPTGQGLIVK